MPPDERPKPGQDRADGPQGGPVIHSVAGAIALAVRSRQGPAMSPAAEPVLRLTTPGDIVAAIPHLCGFTPTESLVAISLRGERKRIGLALRFDLPGVGLDEVAADEVAARLAFDGARAAVVVVYGESPQRRPDLV